MSNESAVNGRIERSDGSAIIRVVLDKLQRIMLLVKLLLMANIGLQMNEAFLFDLDLALHGSLRKGNALATQSGVYLKDSFRSSVLVTAFGEIIKELKDNRRADMITEIVLAFVSLVLIGGLLTFFLRMRQARAQIRKCIQNHKV